MALIIYIGKGCNGSTAPEDDSTIVASPKINEGPSTETALTAHESFKVKLPDGVELDAFKGGIEDQLVTFLNNPSALAGKNVWFDFDNLNFKTGSADITEESIKQVQNIAVILKAYPKLKIKIGGYTDKTGDSLSNFKLSQGRAESVLSALKSSGANPSQLLGAEGYGSSNANAPADAPDEERKKEPENFSQCKGKIIRDAGCSILNAGTGPYSFRSSPPRRKCVLSQGVSYRWQWL